MDLHPKYTSDMLLSIFSHLDSSGPLAVAFKLSHRLGQSPMGRQPFSVYGPHPWNSLPKDLRA
uniref:Uncharacterized protein n=1 Tax=Anguilla anguilla TaxID=7936 RepID=A0A0E9T968_ANGAN